MSYKVFQVDYIGMPRNHRGIFVETHEDGEGSGYLYHVTGNIQAGMIHEHRKEERPETNITFAGLKKFRGTVAIDNYPRVRSICDSVPAPKKQFNGPKRIYPNEPLKRCQEWAEEAMQKLISQGVVVEPTSTTTDGTGS